MKLHSDSFEHGQPIPPEFAMGARDGDNGFGGVHSGVTLFVMCDGSVQSISKETDLPVLDRLATRAGDDQYDINGTAKSCLP